MRFQKLFFIFAFLVGCQHLAEAKKLLVVGGTPYVNGKYFPCNVTEIIDLNTNANAYAVAKYPIDCCQGAVGTFINNKAMVCSANDGKACYNYDVASNTWTSTFSMLNNRWGPAIQISDTQWWVTGGRDSFTHNAFISTELFTVGSGFSYYVNLPVALASHCLVQVNASSVMVIGGTIDGPNGAFSWSLGVWLFNTFTQTFTPLPNLLAVFSEAECGLITYPNGGPKMVAVQSEGKTQMFNLNTQVWSYGPTIDAGIFPSIGVQNGDTMLLVGGINGFAQSGLSTIYQFVTSPAPAWTLLPQRLSSPRYNGVGMLIPDPAPAVCAKGVLTTYKVQEIKQVILTNIIDQFGNGTVQLAQAIRLAFHDCTGGCNGCLNKQDPGNTGRFINTFDALNALYTSKGYFNVLSRADFYALAAIVGIEKGIQIANMGCSNNCIPMHSIQFKYCRQDCATSPNAATNDGLPDGKINHTQTMNFFSGAFGLNERLATALLGVHTVGFCGGNQSSGFVGSWKRLADANNVALNTKFNNGYYQNLVNPAIQWTQINTQDPGSALGPKWQWIGNNASNVQLAFMLNTDMSLLKEITTDSNGKSACTFATCAPTSTSSYFNLFANNATAWMIDFSTAFTQMIGTGNPNLFVPQNSG